MPLNRSEVTVTGRVGTSRYLMAGGTSRDFIGRDPAKPGIATWRYRNVSGPLTYICSLVVTTHKDVKSNRILSFRSTVQASMEIHSTDPRNPYSVAAHGRSTAERQKQRLEPTVLARAPLRGLLWIFIFEA